MKPKFVRFVVAGERSEDWRHWDVWSLTGIITIARIEKNKGRFTPENRQIINETFQWLNDNIPCPPWSKKDWKDAISWWRIDAKEPISHLRPLVQVLRKHGLVVRTIYADNPGKILYKDKFQVIAIDPTW